LVTASFAVWLTGCRAVKESEAYRNQLKGAVISVDANNQQIVVNHEAIPGYMEAMTMGYRVKSAKDLDGLAVGDEIRATLVVRDDDAWLENIVVTRKRASSRPRPSLQLHIPGPGDKVPDFVLVDQADRRVRFSTYRGKAMLLTFIYTRCPLPDYCPPINLNLAKINEALLKDKNLYAKTHLLSISFDPEHDTPSVLRTYGAAFTEKVDKGFKHWEFAAIPQPELKDVASFCPSARPPCWPQNVGRPGHKVKSAGVPATATTE
jgi:protein SCO1/2